MDFAIFAVVCVFISALFCTTRRWTIQKRWYLPYVMALYALVIVAGVLLFIYL